MFAKLLKYEWKATAGTLGVFSLAAVGAGIVAAVLLRVLSIWGDVLPFFLVAPAAILVMGAFLAVYAYLIGGQILLLVRFYKNKFTDEGYLTFTLPVTSHQILLSSLVNYLIWMVIIWMVTVGTMLLVMVVGSAREGLINAELFTGILRGLHEMWYIDGAGMFMVLGVLYMLATISYSVMMTHTAIVLGATFAKKHKILAAFGFGYAIHMVISILSASAMIAYMIFGLNNMLYESSAQTTASMNAVLLPQILLFGAVSVAGYLISNRLIKNKLNLP